MSGGNLSSIERATPALQVLRGGAVRHHHHDGAYAAIVLDGGYIERGDAGVMVAEAGDIVVHLPFDHHGNAIDRSGARICNLPLTPGESLTLRSGRLRDRTDIIDRFRSGLSLADVLAVTAPCRIEPMHEADELARALLAAEAADLRTHALLLGRPARTLRRYFHANYGMTAAQFRLRARTRRAWRTIMTTDRPLALIAVEAHFADQAHMTRAVAALTGRTPAAWRPCAGRSVQDCAGDLALPGRHELDHSDRTRRRGGDT